MTPAVAAGVISFSGGSKRQPHPLEILQKGARLKARSVPVRLSTPVPHPVTPESNLYRLLSLALRRASEIWKSQWGATPADSTSNDHRLKSDFGTDWNFAHSTSVRALVHSSLALPRHKLQEVRVVFAHSRRVFVGQHPADRIGPGSRNSLAQGAAMFVDPSVVSLEIKI